MLGGWHVMDAGVTDSVGTIGDRGRGRHFLAFMIMVLALGLLYPKPLFMVGDKYPFFSNYLVWIPAVLWSTQSLTKQGRRGGVSALLWVLRAYIIVSFLVMRLAKQSLTSVDLFSVAGVLLPTFMYEVGLQISRTGFFPFALRSVCLGAVLWSLQPAVAAFMVVLRSGPAAALFQVSLLRTLNPAWPNGVGMLMAVVVLILLELSPHSSWQRLVQYVAFLVLLVTLSRTAVVLLALGLTVRQVLLGKRLTTILVLVLACVLAFAMFQAKGVLPQNSLHHTAMGRYVRWKATLSVWKESPIMGQGFRSYDESIGYYWNPYASAWLKVGSSHNDFVDLLVRGGLLFGLIFALLLILWVRQAWGKRRSAEMRICLLTACMILVAGLSQNPLKYGPLVSLFWLVVGAGVYPWERGLAR